MTMRIAIAGKGGVGKTSLSAALAKTFAARGQRVIAVDADADGNLADALGVPSDQIPQPISALKDLIRERTGAKEEGYGGYLYPLGGHEIKDSILTAFPWMQQYAPLGTFHFPYEIFMDKDFSHGDFLDGRYTMGPVANIDLMYDVVKVMKYRKIAA